MTTSGGLLRRLVRLAHLGANPLARSVDRIEGMLVGCVLLLALLLMPVAATVGSSAYAHQAEVVEQQAAQRQQTDAVLLKEIPDAGVHGNPWDAMPDRIVLARWDAPDGGTTEGEVPVSHGVPLGSSVQIWVDESGKRVSAPLDAEVAGAFGFGVGLLSWLGGVLLLALGFLVARWVLNRVRYAEWERAWERQAFGS
ncbi:MAG: hypothetical protein GEU98_01585 [Pseudonocardiaceae bacterium]|nr:hypothetical protein [Pseudonocardiaceae bacterium]